MYSCLRYPSINAHALYYVVIYDLSGSTIFFTHYPLSGTAFGKMLLNTKCVLIFSRIFVRNSCHSENNSARYFRKRSESFHTATSASLNDNAGIRTNFQISLFMKMSPVWVRLFVRKKGRTDIYDESHVMPTQKGRFRWYIMKYANREWGYINKSKQTSLGVY